jgi:hypothetical protein
MPVDRNDTVCAMSQVCQVAVGEVLTAPAPWPAQRFSDERVGHRDDDEAVTHRDGARRFRPG